MVRSPSTYEDVRGEQAGAGGQQVPLTGPRPVPGPDRGLIAAHHVRQDDQLPDQLVAPTARASIPCTNPGEGFAPVSESIRSAHRCNGQPKRNPGNTLGRPTRIRPDTGLSRRYSTDDPSRPT
jgi:hypothetical protein